jgi:hypothetical protein
VEEDRVQGHWHVANDEKPGSNRSNDTVGASDADTTNPLTSQGNIGSPSTDGVNGTPRTGATTRENSIGTQWGLTY